MKQFTELSITPIPEATNTSIINIRVMNLVVIYHRMHRYYHS